MTAYVYNKIATFCCKVTQTSHKKTVGKENKKLKNCISLGIIKPILNLLAILHILFIHVHYLHSPHGIAISNYLPWFGQPGVNFINILRAAFASIFLRQKLFVLAVWLCNFAAQEYWGKSRA